jgi:hypothetical protein
MTSDGILTCLGGGGRGVVVVVVVVVSVVVVGAVVSVVVAPSSVPRADAATANAAATPNRAQTDKKPAMAAREASFTSSV